MLSHYSNQFNGIFECIIRLLPFQLVSLSASLCFVIMSRNRFCEYCQSQCSPLKDRKKYVSKRDALARHWGKVIDCSTLSSIATFFNFNLSDCDSVLSKKNHKCLPQHLN